MNLSDKQLPVEWLEDECLYSLISRVHRLSGNIAAGQTTRFFFSDAKLGGSPQVTTHLDALQDNTAGLLGTVEDLVFNKQVAAYYRIGLTTQERQSLLQTMKGSANAKQARALMRNSMPSFQLRLCAACAEQDRKNKGVAYWHLSHQLPCTAVCLEHMVLLQTVVIPGSTSWLSRWMLPDAFPIVKLEGKQCAKELTSCATTALALARVSAEEYVSMSRLGAIWNAATPSVHERARELIAQIAQVTQGSYISIRSHNPASNEITHLPVTIEAMGCDVGSFFNLYKNSSSAGAVESRSCVNKEKKQATLSLINSGLTTSAAAKIVGVDVKTAQVWSSRAGGDPKKRPKKLRGQVELTAKTMLQLGAEKQTVMKSLNLSEPTINTMLGIHPILRDQWQLTRKSTALAFARACLEKTGGSFPMASTKVCRILEPAAYAFLYRNDRQWLMSFSAGRPKPPSDVGTSCKWDEEIARSLDTLMNNRNMLPTHPNITSLDLLHTIPKLSAKVEYLLFMPATCSSLLSLRKSLKTRQTELF
jgi:hypothetical protein